MATHLDVVTRQDHKAGEKLFVDFPGLTISIYDGATLQVSYRAELFVAVLGASNYFFCEALRSLGGVRKLRNAHYCAYLFERMFSRQSVKPMMSSLVVSCEHISLTSEVNGFHV